MGPFTTLDLLILVAYLGGSTVWGIWLGRGQRGGTDYFLGSRQLPWAAVMLSIVATETSSLTFLSVPGVAYMGSMTFLQLTLGYVVGRTVVAIVLLPLYNRGRLHTAYALLEGRFGTGARRFTSGTFMLTRLLADSVRLFATAIPLALITGWPYPASIAIIAVLTVVYTYLGGLKAVVWVDTLQMVLYLGGAIAAAVALQGLVPGGWGAILSTAGAAGKLQTLDFSLHVTEPYTFWAGIMGGMFLSIGSHGVDQMTVQRLLACRDLKAGQKAIVGSGVAVMFQFVLFLGVGVGMWVFYQGRAFERSDEIFARFILEELPQGLRGLLIAGVFAAAMSSLASSINSLASTSAYDFWAPLVGAEGDEKRTLRAGRVLSLLWAALLIGGAIAFIPLSRRTAAVEVALGVASLVYGGLVGAFALGVLTKRPGQIAAIVGMAVGILVVTVFQRSFAWPWYSLVGTLVTMTVGIVVGYFRRRTA